MDISPKDYEKLKAFVATFMEFYAEGPVSPEVHPLSVLANLEKASMARAKKGLVLAVQDLVESTAGWSPEQVAEADRRFASRGAFELGEMRRRYSRRYLEVMRRGSIRSLPEYYLLKSVADGGSIEPGASEVDEIIELMTAYEARRHGKR